MSNTSPSFTWVKQVTEIGLTFMTPKARRSRLEEVMKIGESGEQILDCEALANLIDECKATAGVYLEQHGERMNTSDADKIQSMLKLIDGKEAVATTDPDALTEWVRDLINS